MSQLIKNPEIAGALIGFLEQQVAEGHQWVVYDSDSPICSTWDLHCFWEHIDALDFEREYQQIFNWHVAVPINELNMALKEIEHSFKNKNMNRNSLEDFREQAAALKIPAAMQEQIEKQMELNLPYIAVTVQLPSHKGHLEATAHLKQGAGDSEYYFFNKYDLAYNSKAKPLSNDYQYAVRTDTKDGEVLEKPLLRRFDSSIAAVDFFNLQKGNSELFTGKVSANGKLTEGQSLATMKDGKVDYVTRDFQAAYRNTVVRNTVYVNKGVGFNMTQSSNMLQGGAAHRDDLVSRAGEQYQAWNVYKFDEPRDKYGNLMVKQYGEGYPFNLEKELSNYRIKGLDNPEKFNAIVAEMKDGNRPVVTALTEAGEQKKLHMEAVPRFSNLNFFSTDNKPVNREQFQKVVKQGKDMSAGKEKNVSSSQEMTM